MNSAEHDKGMSRRRFVRGAAAGGAAGLAFGAGAGLFMKESEKPWIPDNWDYETDVVVVGSGYAGCNAAIAAHDAGATVLVLERSAQTGGVERRQRRGN